MARTARCTSCGAPVEFKSVVSVLAVCDYCQSTLVRDGKEIANLGKMADLIEDRSPLQRGAEGRWLGLHFAIVGRIQLQWEQGLWNEWHLLFDDGASGWLSEAGGEYVISMPKRSADAPQDFAALQIGQVCNLAGRDYTVTNLLTATCVAGEGELPFKVGAGYPAPAADLRDEEGGFATLDYSDGRPLLFVGETIDFKSLGWSNLREKIPLPDVTITARAFNCPSCAAALEISHENIQTVGCRSCGAVLDTSNPTVKLLSEVPVALLASPRIPLGTRGKLRGTDVEVIGFMGRHGKSEDEVWHWQEYVLLGPDGRLLWLSEYNGHWNVGETLKRAVRPQGMKVVLGDQNFEHFQTCAAGVDFVLGEFPWRVSIEDVVQSEDFIAPPAMLSHEVNAQEETWALMEYIEPERVQEAFKLKPAFPRPEGIYANQINPHAEPHALVCGRFWKFMLAAMVVHFAMLFFAGGRVLHEQALTFDGSDDEPQLTREFRLERSVSRLDVEHQTDISNNWVSMGVTLLNKDTNEVWQATREISHYDGLDGDGYWSEGSRVNELTFANLPAGTYVLAEEAELGGSETAINNMIAAAPFGQSATARKPVARPVVKPVHARVKISRAGPRWSSLMLLAGGLILFPIYTRTRRYVFESKRWAESDHPHVYNSSSDSDSDGDSGGDD